MCAALAVLALLGSVFPADGAPAKPLAVHGEKLGSVHLLMEQAYPLAKKWNSEAVLLLVIGSGPSNVKIPFGEEEWRLVFFAKPKANQTFQVWFKEGVLTRSGEQLESKWAAHCSPIDVVFVDTPKIEDMSRGLELDIYGHRHFVLYRPKDGRCLPEALYQSEAAAERFAGRSLWSLAGTNAEILLDAKTGKRLARFAKK